MIVAAGLSASVHVERLADLGIGSSAVTRDGQSAPAQERRVAVEAGFEQSWRLAARPAGKGPLEVRVETGLTLLGADGQGLHLRDAQGRGVRYGTAFWVDARGARTELRPLFQPGAIVLQVPAELVDRSEFPAVLDPLVGPELTFGGKPLGPAIYDSEVNLVVGADSTQYFVAWGDYRRSRQCEIFGTRVGTDGQIRDPGLTVAREPPDGCPTVTGLDFDGTSFVLGLSAATSLSVVRVSTDGGIVDADPAPVGLGQYPRIARGPTGALYLYRQLTTSGDVLHVVHFAPDGTVGGDQLILPDMKFDDADRMPVSRATDIACDGTRCLALWADGRNDGSDLYGVFLKADASLDGAPFPIAAGAGLQIGGRLAYGAGEYLVVWDDTATGNRDVRGAIVTTAGAVQPSFDIASTSWWDFRPAVAYDGTSFVVAWENDASGGSVRAARVDAMGTVLDVGGVAVADGEVFPSYWYERSQLELASPGTGQSLVAWRTTAGIIAGRRLQGATPIDGPPLRFGDAAPAQGGPAMATNALGQTLLVRSESVSGPSFIGTVVSDAGVGLAHVLSAGAIAYGASVATDGQIFWVGMPMNYIAQGLFVGADGTPLAAMPTVLTTATNHSFWLSTRYEGPGFLTVWGDDRHTSMPYAIFARRSYLDGGLDPEFEVSPGGANKINAALATNANGVSLIVWEGDYSVNSVDGVRVQGTTVLDVPPLHFSGHGVDNAVGTDGTDFLVAFSEGHDVLGTFVPASGPYNSGARFPIVAGPSNEFAPSIAFDGTDYLVGYESNADARGGVYAAILHRDGGAEPPLVISDVPNETEVSVSATAVGPALWRVAWSQFDPTPGVSAMRLHLRTLVTDDRHVVLDDGGVLELGDGGFVVPHLLSTNNGFAFCGAPYIQNSGHRPEVLGDGPLSFSVGASAGESPPPTLAIDGASGEIHWTPSSADLGLHHLRLTVSGPGGSASQDFTVQVECAGPTPLRQGCGCQSGSVELVAALAALSLRRRRARTAQVM